MSGFETWASEEIAQLRQGTHLTAPSPHQSLFRYIGLNTKRSWDLLERTLQRSEMSGATAHSLNDPYELSPVRFDDLSTRTLFSIPGVGVPAAQPVSNEERKRIDELRAKANAYLDSKIKNARIIAFCQQSQSPLLWSHYANSYKGA